MSATTIHQGPAYQLSLEVHTTLQGHHLRFVSISPTAPNPRQLERFQDHLSSAGLRALRGAIEIAIQRTCNAAPEYSRRPSQASVYLGGLAISGKAWGHPSAARAEV
jgi:hypothetical protein